MVNMEKNNQPLILGAMVIGAILIIALALIFTRGGDETSTETVSENNTSESQENRGGEENNGGGQQPETPEQPENPEAPEQPENPGTGILPSNWNSLTPQEKNELNPYGCNLETQILYAEDGSCHDKQIPPTQLDGAPFALTGQVVGAVGDNPQPLSEGITMVCYYSQDPSDDHECHINLHFQPTKDLDVNLDSAPSLMTKKTSSVFYGDEGQVEHTCWQVSSDLVTLKTGLGQAAKIHRKIYAAKRSHYSVTNGVTFYNREFGGLKAAERCGIINSNADERFPDTRRGVSGYNWSWTFDIAAADLTGDVSLIISGDPRLEIDIEIIQEPYPSKVILSL